MGRASFGGFALVHWLVMASVLQGQDLRQQFGTRSAAAAEALNEGIRLVQAQKSPEAIPVLARALKADPDLQLAYYWTALAHHDLGQIDEALATYEKQVAVAERTMVNNVTIDACINAGLTLAQLKDEDKACQWFTRAIMYDPRDLHKLQWKAYRNMAIGQHQRGKNLAAMLCALSGYQSDPRKVELKMVSEFLDRADKDEVAQILNFGEAPPKPKKREAATKLSEAKPLPEITVAVTQLLSDLSTHHVVAISRGSATYHLIDSDQQNAVRTIEAPGNVVSGCLIAGRLYLSIQGTGIVEVDLLTGKSQREWKLSSGAPASFAVLPAKGIALFPVSQVLTTLDLETGKTEASDYYVDGMVADPAQKFCYCYKRSEEQSEVGHVIINGRPVLLQRTIGSALQTSILKFGIADKRPVIAELRMNAASNGRVLHVSPDGQWIGIAGGGGWRPVNNAGHGAGYGIAIFSTKDLSHVQGFYATEAYPQTVAINPATGQVAALRAGDGKIYDLAKGSEPVAIAGKFTFAATWSRSGKYLYAADNQGVRAYENEVTADEIAAVAELSKQISAVVPERPKKSPSSAAEIEPLTEYKTFVMKDDREATLAAIKLALAEGRMDRPQEWLSYEPYQQDAALRQEFGTFVNKSDREGAGVRIYMLKKLKKDHPEHLGIDFLLGMSYYVAAQYEAAEAAHLSALQADQGRTNVSTEALRCLAEIAKKTNRSQAAAYCMAHWIRLDRGTDRVSEARPFFAQAQVLEQASELLARKSTPATSALSLPELKFERGDKKLSAEELFAAAASSVVLIHTEKGTGSGVCVGERGLILTNAHVIGEKRGDVRVISFKLDKDKIERLEPLAAEIIYRSDDEDIAILRIADAPPSLVPLSLEMKTLQAGGRVYSMGHPGLGEEVLEQSITDGIVSSPNRRLDNKTYVQHTAPVNPGNSGGPLLNEHGHIVGIVTFKANLQNISFAIPASRLQSLFKSLATD